MKKFSLLSLVAALSFMAVGCEPAAPPAPSNTNDTMPAVAPGEPAPSTEAAPATPPADPAAPADAKPTEPAK